MRTNTILRSIAILSLLLSSALNSGADEKAAVAATVPGVWKWAGSATDDNENGKADADEWNYRDAAWEAATKKAGVDPDDLDMHFEADGTGFTGKTKKADNLLTWKKNQKNQIVVTSAATPKDVSTFIITEKGELISWEKGKQAAYELFRKAK